MFIITTISTITVAMTICDDDDGGDGDDDDNDDDGHDDDGAWLLYD